MIDEIILFQSIFEIAVEGILVIDDKGFIIKVNPSVEKMFGYEKEELIGEKIEILIPKEYRDIHKKHRATYNKNPKTRAMGEGKNLFGLNKNGSRFTLEISLSYAKLQNKVVVIAFIVDITKRTLANKAIETSEFKLAEAQDLAHIGSWFWNLKTNERNWSDEFYKICGLEPGDTRLNAETVINFIHPDDRENALKEVENVIKNKSSYNYEKRIIRPDNSIRHVLAKGKVEYDKDGIPLSMMGTMQDISDFKKVNEALYEGNRKYNTLINNLQGIVYRCKNNKDWEMEYISNGCFKITKYKPIEFTSNKIHFGQIILEKDRETIWNKIQKALLEKKTYSLEYRIKDKNGTIKYVWEQGEGVFCKNGKVIALEGYISDITEQYNTSLELQNSKKQLEEYSHRLEEKVEERTKEVMETVQKLVESNLNLEDQIQITNNAKNSALESEALSTAISKNFPKGIIAVINNNFEILYIEGEALDQLKLRNLFSKRMKVDEISIFSLDQKTKLKQDIIKTIDGEHRSFEVEYNNNYFSVNTIPLFDEIDEKITRALLVYNNISLQKKTEKDIENALLEEKKLNELKSRFISMASHEFRTPLSAIKTSAILIGKLNKNNEIKTQKYVDQIQNNIKNLVHILNDFLSLSKLEEGKILVVPLSFDIIQFTLKLIEEIKPSLKNEQTITLHHTFKTKEVYLDPKLLRQILSNLISNASKYSVKSSNIDFKISSNHKKIFIEIIDQGIGVPEDDKNELFQRFFRAKNVTNIEGTGIGLNIVKQYLELMKGRISVESELQKGSKFSVELPIKI